MGRFNLVGSSYTSQSPLADGQALINWYEETIESGVGKGASALYPTPGLNVFAVIGAGPVRAAATINGRAFFVSDSGFYEVTAAGKVTLLGAVANDGNPAYIVASTTQVVIASGLTAYLFTLSTNTFQAIANLSGIQIAKVEVGDRFFFALQAPQANADAKIYSSNAGDGSTWNLLNFAAPSVYPDSTVGMIADHRQLIVYSATRMVAYYDQGAAQFPYAVIEGSDSEIGLGAVGSVTRLDNSVFWWDADERGAGIARRLQSFTPVRISDHGVEFAVQGYSTIADAISYAYQDQGHTFWVTYFPTANKTWVYDVAKQKWHQRGFWNTQKGAYDAHRSRCHVYAFGKHLVGDWATGNVYQMSIPVVKGSGWDFVTDFGQQIVRTRIAPVLSLEDEWMFFDKIIIDAEVGLGPQPPLTDGSGTARDPQGILSWSNDAGKTYNEPGLTMNFGQAGNYLTRAVLHRLGKARKGRVFRFTVSDPIPWRIIDAYIYGSGFGPAERLPRELSQRA